MEFGIKPVFSNNQLHQTAVYIPIMFLSNIEIKMISASPISFLHGQFDWFNDEAMIVLVMSQSLS